MGVGEGKGLPYQVDSIYIDYSNAFDPVNHSLLLTKLNILVIGDIALE